MTENSPYYFERLSAANFNQFVDLHNEVFKKKTDSNYFKKKYDTTHIVNGYWVYMAFDKVTKKAVASAGVIPWVISSNREKLLAAQSADLMTSSAHRGNGLYETLFQKVVLLLKEHHFKFIFGFPNQHSYKALLKNPNWKFYGHLNYYDFKKHKTFPLRKISHRTPWTNQLHDLYIHHIFKRHEASIAEIQEYNQNQYGTDKTTEFYHHKLSGQHKIVKTGHSIAFIKITNKMLIGEIQSRDKSTLKNDIDTLSRLAAKTGITNIDFFCKSGSTQDNILSESHQSKETFPVAIYEIEKSEIPYDKIDFTLVDFDTF